MYLGAVINRALSNGERLPAGARGQLAGHDHIQRGCSLKGHKVRSRVLLGRESNATSKGKRCMTGSMDTLGIEPRASRMLSGCDTTTPRALLLVSTSTRLLGPKPQLEAHLRKVRHSFILDGISNEPPLGIEPRTFSL